MKHKLAIQGLENLKQELITQRNEEMRKVAAPYNVKIEDIDFSISELRIADAREAFKEVEYKPQEIKHTHGGSNRRKRIDHNAIEFKVYPFEEGIISKFKYVLKEANRFLSISQVAHRVKEYEANSDIEDIIIRFGKHAAKYERQGFIKSIGAGKGKKYGLPTWFKDGVLLPGHEPTNTLFELGEMFKKLKVGNVIEHITPNMIIGNDMLKHIEAQRLLDKINEDKKTV